MFGDFIKEKRLKKDLSLREFCRRLDEDPSNWSKVERGVLPPPQDKNKLNHVAKILGLLESTEDYNYLFDCAKTDAGIIPDYIMSDKKVLETLPIFFRTMGSVKPTTEEINELIDKLKNGGNSGN